MPPLCFDAILDLGRLTIQRRIRIAAATRYRSRWPSVTCRSEDGVQGRSPDHWH